MAQQIADRKDIDFVLYEQLEVNQLLRAEQYQDLNRKMLDMVITEARNFAIKEILPTLKEGDEVGVKLENGKVQVPECFRRPYELYTQGEWLAVGEDPKWGGQGFPHIIEQVVAEFMIGGNFCFGCYGILGHGTGKMIETFGTEQQKQLYLKNLYTGKWGGSMQLTEPEAGSDVGALTTTAIKNDDGTYSITGNKIFISNGDQNLTENIIHPVLARVEGAPSGTKGISIFLVPKIWVNEDGSLGEPNDLVVTGIEEKMGLHASPTCSIALGGKGRCRGVLLGEENKGMIIMFHMMNKVRLDVGIQGLNHASNSYLAAAAYAAERRQGKDPDPSVKTPQVPIINHPDVRRMLLWMKAYVEGIRSFVYYTAFNIDRSHCAKNPEERSLYNGLVELMTPVVKAYSADRGFEVCVQAMQVHGGYGYTKEFPVEQQLRDCKIASIYEGANGIQAMDLLGRKIGMNKGEVFGSFLKEIEKTIAQSMEIEGLKDLALKLTEAKTRLGEVAQHLGGVMGSTEYKNGLACAYPFLEVMGDVIMAWMLLWRANVAAPKVKNKVKKDVAFYEGQILSAQYYITSILPVTLGKIDAIMNGNDAVLKINEKSFRF